jgi:adenosylcobyric acid synthase
MFIDKDSAQDEMAERRLKVIVPVLPYISNNTDFDVLRVHPNVDLQFVQMLGNTIHDPYGLGGIAGSEDGFGWLMVETTLEKAKPLKPVVGKLGFIDVDVTGDEAHIGVSIGPALSQPV